MALQCLAILGTNNEPLYLLDTSETDSSPSEQEDCLGFTDPAWQKANRSSTLSIQHEVRLLLELLEELVNISRTES
jgi:hypothetical protein